MVGIFLGIILLGVGGFFLKIKKNVKIGALCLIPGVLILGISMIVLGLGGGSSDSSNATASNNRSSNSGGESVSGTRAVLVSTSESDFTVTLTDDGMGAVITGYIGNATTIQIPPTIQGMPVREIDRWVLSSGRAAVNDTITSVVIPEGVTVIREQAFRQAQKLTSVTIPESVIEIQKMAFYGTALNSVALPKNLKTLETGIFARTNISTITIPQGIEVIASEYYDDEGAFYNCKNLKTVNIPEGVTLIHNAMFGGCTALTSITLPASVNTIGMWAFASSGLTSITIPESVTNISIHEQAFEGSTNLNLASQALLRRLGYSGTF